MRRPYTFVVLLAPIALLLDGARRAWSATVIALYVVVELPLFPWDKALFPKAWLMLALFLVAGWPFLRNISPPMRWATVLAVICISVAATVANMRVYRVETAQTRQPAVAESNSIYSGSPTLGGDGWINEAIGGEQYFFRESTRESTTNGTRSLKFDGDAFHPSAARQGHTIAFELVANGNSHIELLNQDTKELRIVAGDVLNPREPGAVRGWGEAGFHCGGLAVSFRGQCVPGHSDRRNFGSRLLPRQQRNRVFEGAAWQTVDRVAIYPEREYAHADSIWRLFPTSRFP